MMSNLSWLSGGVVQTLMSFKIKAIMPFLKPIHNDKRQDSIQIFNDLCEINPLIWL